MQIHFKAYEVWIHSLFAVAFIIFTILWFFCKLNPQKCMVLAIFKYTCPLSQQALWFLASRLFSFSPALLFSASSWNCMEWDTFYFAAQFWKSWVAWAIVELLDQFFFFYSDKGQIANAFKQLSLKIGCLVRFSKCI